MPYNDGRISEAVQALGYVPYAVLYPAETEFLWDIKGRVLPWLQGTQEAYWKSVATSALDVSLHDFWLACRALALERKIQGVDSTSQPSPAIAAHGVSAVAVHVVQPGDVQHGKGG